MRNVLAPFVSGILAAVAFLPGVLAPGPGQGAAPACPEARGREAAPAYPCAEAGCRIDDTAAMKQFAGRLASLKRKGRTPKISTLIEQLKRAKHRLSLPAPAKAVLGPVKVYQRCRRSVLVVGGLYKCKKSDRWHISTASGFAIAGGGIIVTNYHVVNNPDRVVLGAMTHDGKVYPVREVLAANEHNDVAILKLADADVPPLALRPDSPVGTAVYAISHPDRKLYTLTGGILSRRFFRIERGRKTAAMTITADFAKGSSGGPVLDASGAVVGMVDSTKSLYAKRDKAAGQNLQMVVKICVPARAILDCVSR